MPVYAAAILLSAFLLFLVQPMIGKFILPWFGGSPAVWTTCMLFFQTLLLGGYALAHALHRLGRPRLQAVLYVLGLAGAALLLPITPADEWKPADSNQPVGRILLLMLVCVGGPYLMLSSTGPLLQAWFSRAHPGRSPYRLYALSNLGSFGALLAYPLLVEPTVSRSQQAALWSWGFAGYALLGAVVAAGLWRRASAERNVPGAEHAAPRVRPSAPAPGPADRVLWFALPACGTVLLLAVTSELTQDVAVIPFLWVLPLSLYLLSFVVSFSGERWYPRPVFIVLCLAALATVYGMLDHRLNLSMVGQIVAYLAALFVACMVCHGELYRLRPDASRLTGFYLVIAGGGAAGGAFVAVLAPLVFDAYYELTLGFAAAAALLALAMHRRGMTNLRLTRWTMWMVLLAALSLAYVGFQVRPGARLPAPGAKLLASQRNFYGLLAVFENDIRGAGLLSSRNPESAGATEHFRELLHGRISHGLQFLDEPKQRWGTGYYSPISGGGLAVQFAGPRFERRVGIVGLGIGTLATYGRPRDAYRFYEINPDVERLARAHFTYLSSSTATVEVILGDARLSMEREQPQAYDVLVLDAFTGDAIPVHLLTLEAFATYRRHLKPGGVVAVHISNRYVDLQPVLRAVADGMQWSCALVTTTQNTAFGIGPSEWMLLTDDASFLAIPQVKARLKEVVPAPLVRPWTDDWSSLLPLLGQKTPLSES